MFTPLDLINRLARLIPPPHTHRHRYHGVLAPLASPRCGTEMRIIAFVTDGVSVRRILTHIGKPTDSQRPVSV